MPHGPLTAIGHAPGHSPTLGGARWPWRARQAVRSRRTCARLLRPIISTMFTWLRLPHQASKAPYSLTERSIPACIAHGYGAPLCSYRGEDGPIMHEKCIREPGTGAWVPASFQAKPLRTGNAANLPVTICR